MWGKPSAPSSRAGKFSSMHLIAYRQRCSCLTTLTKRRTISSRSLTELMFQVARRKRMMRKIPTNWRMIGLQFTPGESNGPLHQDSPNCHRAALVTLVLQQTFSIAQAEGGILG